ncbi:ROK family protein [Candidatus Nitrosotenuis chungbukensis]|uniref:ROK family protein n=1 Tax=Candidatus Nitrosotenuis chungbukensis TaxID=1353246 RepID=UPI0005B28F3F|nr:ROK family protein [Candidatus Nitrosotenuis chungbukensis]WKT58704.1 ROK family protein [Candidatus Nitrosotenuis chungbukensis]
MYKVGIDLGGTKIEGICLDEKSQIVERKRVPTNQREGYDSILNSISVLVSDITKNIPDYAIGICTPGAISKKTGMIKNSNTQCLIGMPLKNDLEKILGKKIAMENDANCFAMAEATMGAAAGYSVVFGVIMGTGVGGGIIVDGKIHRGRTNIAGEWGHHTLHQNGNKCYCGKSGCVETYISGPALEKRWFEITGRKEPLTTIVQNLDGTDGKMWKKEFLDNFGVGLANVIDILDPDAIVLGGGISNIDFLYTDGRDSVYDKVFSDLVDTPILKNKLGDSAGVFGAALL